MGRAGLMCDPLCDPERVLPCEAQPGTGQVLKIQKRPLFSLPKTGSLQQSRPRVAQGGPPSRHGSGTQGSLDVSSVCLPNPHLTQQAPASRDLKPGAPLPCGQAQESRGLVPRPIHGSLQHPAQRWCVTNPPRAAGPAPRGGSGRGRGRHLLFAAVDLPFLLGGQREHSLPVFVGEIQFILQRQQTNVCIRRRIYSASGK